MSYRSGVAAVMASLLAAGCQAFHHDLAVPLGDRAAVSNPGFESLAVGVRRPRSDDPIPPEWRWLEPQVRLDFATSRAQRLIDHLNGSLFFREVAFEDDLTAAPDLVISPAKGPPHEGVDGQNFMLTLLTLGILPVFELWQSGVYFERVDTDGPDFDCDWPTHAVTGIVAYPLLVSDSWHYRFDEGAFDYHLQQCLADQEDVFAR